MCMGIMRNPVVTAFGRNTIKNRPVEPAVIRGSISTNANTVFVTSVFLNERNIVVSIRYLIRRGKPRIAISQGCVIGFCQISGSGIMLTSTVCKRIKTITAAIIYIGGRIERKRMLKFNHSMTRTPRVKVVCIGWSIRKGGIGIRIRRGQNDSSCIIFMTANTTTTGTTAARFIRIAGFLALLYSGRYICTTQRTSCGAGNIINHERRVFAT